MKVIRTLLLALLLFLCLGCAPRTELQNGYFTAESAYFDELGWKEFVSVYIHNNRIITVEYNAKNASGFLKSWDMEYMRQMNEKFGTYPTKFARTYTSALLNRQDPEKIDLISGATTSYHSFRTLTKAALERARTGDKRVAFIDFSN